MNKNRVIGTILLSICGTILIQWNLTRAIIFDGYLSRPEIVYENNDETYYLSLINESAKGNFGLGSPFLKEHREDRFLYPALNVNIVGLKQSLLGWDLKTIMILFDYVTVFVVVALVLILFLTIFQFQSSGYLAGLFYLFLPRIFHALKRPISPQINLIFLLVFFIFYFSRLSFWRRELGMAVVTGIMFYTYPYHWTFVLVLLALSDLWTFVREKKITIRYFVKYGIVAVMSIGYWINFFAIRALPYYQESMNRIGALESRFPAGLYTQVLIIGLLAAFLFWRKHFRNFDKIVLGLTTSLVVLNQQLVTGMQLEFNTHYLPVVLIFVVAFFAKVAFMVWNYFSRKVFVALVFISVVMAVGGRSLYTEVVFSPFLNQQPKTEQQEIFRWFNENKVENAVIYTPNELTEGIPIYTKNYVAFSSLARLQLVSTQELVDRYTYYDVTNTKITEDLLGRHRDIFGVHYIDLKLKDDVIGQLKRIFGLPFVSKPVSDYIQYDFNQIRKKRLSITSRLLEEYLDTYHVDYVIYHYDERDGIYKNIQGEIMFQNDHYTIKKR